MRFGSHVVSKKRFLWVRRGCQASQRKGLTSGEVPELPGKFGKLPGKLGNFWGSLGNFRGTSGLLLSSTVRELPGKSPKTSGEVRGNSGEVRELPRSSGEPDSLPATRQICLQVSESCLILWLQWLDEPGLAWECQWDFLPFAPAHVRLEQIAALQWHQSSLDTNVAVCSYGRRGFQKDSCLWLAPFHPPEFVVQASHDSQRKTCVALITSIWVWSLRCAKHLYRSENWFGRNPRGINLH